MFKLFKILTIVLMLFASPTAFAESLVTDVFPPDTGIHTIFIGEPFNMTKLNKAFGELTMPARQNNDPSDPLYGETTLYFGEEFNSVSFKNNQVCSIYISSLRAPDGSIIETPRGIHVGSTKKDVELLYERENLDDDGDSLYYRIPGTHTAIIFGLAAPDYQTVEDISIL